MKNGFFGNKGITLLALIITIVVLLILSVISISMIVGEDGVIMRARMAEEEQKYAEIEERKELWRLNIRIGYYNGSRKVQDLYSLLEEMVEGGVITEEDAKKILEEGELKHDLIGKSNVFYEISEREGRYLEFAGRLWQILYDDKYTKDCHGLQVVSVEPFEKEISIGYKNNLDEGIKIYNNYIKTLNDACKNVVPNNPFIYSVRSVGTNPILDKHEEGPEKTYKSEFLKKWQDGKYSKYSENSIIESFKNDSDRDALAKIKYIKPGEHAWYANNSTNENATHADSTNDGLHLDIRTVQNSEASTTWYSIIRFTEHSENHNHMSSGISLRIIPVVTLQPGILDAAVGTGTLTDPYKIPEVK